MLQIGKVRHKEGKVTSPWLEWLRCPSPSAGAPSPLLTPLGSGAQAPHEFLPPPAGSSEPSETLGGLVSPPDSPTLSVSLPVASSVEAGFLAPPSLPPGVPRPRGCGCTDLGSKLRSATCWLRYLGRVTFSVLLCKLEMVTPTHPSAWLLGLNLRM